LHFAEFTKNPLINTLYNERLRLILTILDLNALRKSVIVDFGCGKGYFSRVLSPQSLTTIGLDVERQALVKANSANKSSKLHFVLADMYYLPFRSRSIDVAVCASVLEHMRNLDGAIQEIRDVLKNDGMLLAGYPLETRLFRFVWRLVRPQDFRYIDQSQYDSSTCRQQLGGYWECPGTHKQDYRTIRGALRKYFGTLQKKKLPFKMFPDLLSYYECVLARRTVIRAHKKKSDKRG